MSKIGFIGLGKMGTPMVGNLAGAGHAVIAYDLRAEARAGVADISGVRVAEDLRDVGASSDVVITMLPDGRTVDAALLGDGGAATAMGPGSVVIDMSSSAPWETIELGARLRDLEIGLVDAPVSGGVARAVTGDLAVFIGGKPETIAGVESILASLGSQLLRTGGLGTGHTAKALNNLLSAACFAATIEVVRLAEASGIDAHVMAEVLDAATGKNNTTERKLRQFVLSGTYDSGFALGLMVKDLQQSAELATRSEIDVPVSRGIIDLWVAGAARLAPNADHTEIAKLIASSAGEAR